MSPELGGVEGPITLEAESEGVWLPDDIFEFALLEGVGGACGTSDAPNCAVYLDANGGLSLKNTEEVWTENEAIIVADEEGNQSLEFAPSIEVISVTTELSSFVTPKITINRVVEIVVEEEEEIVEEEEVVEETVEEEVVDEPLPTEGEVEKISTA